jgi:hypothetical protein
MRKLFVACGVAAVLSALAAAGPAVAQVREDSVVGSGTSLGLSYAFDAHSGPSGETPTGTAAVEVVSDPSLSVRGRVTCLTVTGNRAVIGIDNSLGSAGFEGAVFEVTDGPTDTIAVFPGGAPTVCPPTSDIANPLDSGDIVVTDAQPFPTRKDQCKNGGWRDFGVFKNQCDCVSFVATGGKNPPAG